jgi:hypothetical protein
VPQEQELQAQLNKLQPDFTGEEARNLQQLLSSPLVRRYFQAQLNMAVNDFLMNEAETSEQEYKLLARFKKLKGIQYVYAFLLNNFKPEVKP